MSIFPITVAQAKELAITGRPLLLGRFLMFDGTTTLYVSSHPLSTSEGGYQYNGSNYYARLLNQSIPGLEIRSTTGIDQIPSVSLDIADADRTLYRALEQGQGFKGALVTVVLIFFAGNSNGFSSDEWIKFQGVASKPAFAKDGTIKIQATATKNLSKTFTPSARFGSRCIWIFPTTLAQRQDAAFNPASHIFECPYCPDVSGIDPIYGDTVTRGNLIGGIAATTCDYTPQNCKTNGMYTIDSSGRPTGAFGGVQWAPPQTAVKSKSYLAGYNVIATSTRNDSIYNQPIPMAYGTCWVNGVPANFVNDGNSARSEVVFSTGQIGEVGGDIDVRGVVANGIWVPRNGQSPDNDIYRWNPANRGSVNAIGTRRGIPTPDAGYNSNGDPYGSMAMIEVVVYSQIAGSSFRILTGGQKVWAYQPIATINGTLVTLPSGTPNAYIAGNPPYTIEIIGNSLSAANNNWQLANWTYGPPGTITLAGSLSGSGTGGYIRYRTYGIPDGNGINPAWMIMDLLTWSNYLYTDCDVMSFANEAAWCATQISYTDNTGNANTHSRFKISCSLEQRRPTDQVVLALLNSCNGQLRTDITTGLRQFFIRKTLADQQPSPGVDTAGHYTSNYNTAVLSMHADGSSGNGYVAYWFNESTLSGPPVEQPRDSSQVTNTVTFPFQDEENQWVQDSISVSDTDDIARVGGYGAGNEVVENWACEGICNFDQGTRVCRVKLAEDIRGNELQDVRGTRIWKAFTNYRVAHLRSGDICLFSWQQLGFRPAVQLQSPSGTYISGILVRILSVEDIGQNFESASVTFRWHEDIWYTDAYGQNPPPVYSDPRKSTPNRPPYPWRGFDVARTSDDALFPLYPYFNFTVVYQQAASGDALPVAAIAGYPIINQFSTIQPPLVPLEGSATSSGGSITAGTRIYGVAAVDSSGNESPMSLFCHITTAAGVTAGTNSIPIQQYDPGTVYFVLYGGTSEPLMTVQAKLYVSSLVGGAIVINQIFSPVQSPPDVVFDHFHIRGRKVVIPGVWWKDVTYSATVGLNALLGINGVTGFDTWTGYFVSKLATSTGSQQNYFITAQTGPTLTLNENPSSGVSFNVGEYAAIRATAKIVSANTIGDPLFVNNGRGTGLGVNSQVGNNVLIIAGTGAGQERPILSNTGTTLTINGTWRTLPDASSVFIVVEPHWLYDSVCASIQNELAGITDNFIGSIVLENTSGLTVLVQVLTEDANGNSLPGYYAPFREIYITGNPGAGAIAANPGYYTIPYDAVHNTFTIDLANGFQQRILLTTATASGGATIATILAIIWTGGTITAGIPSLTLFIDQDSTGDWPLPNITGGSGGFASDVGTQDISGAASTRTTWNLTFHGSVWCYSGVPITGGAIS